MTTNRPTKRFEAYFATIAAACDMLLHVLLFMARSLSSNDCWTSWARDGSPGWEPPKHSQDQGHYATTRGHHESFKNTTSCSSRRNSGETVDSIFKSRLLSQMLVGSTTPLWKTLSRAIFGSNSLQSSTAAFTTSLCLDNSFRFLLLIANKIDGRPATAAVFGTQT